MLIWCIVKVKFIVWCCRVKGFQIRHFVFIPLLLLCTKVEADNSSLAECRSSMKMQTAELSLVNCERNLSSLDQQKFPLVAAKLMLYLHDINNELGNTSVAEDYLSQIKISKTFTQSTEIQYLWFRKIATDHFYDNAYEEAKNYYQSAFEIAKKENKIQWLAKSYNDLASITKKQGDFPQALTYFQKSLALKEELGNDFYTANTLSNLGLIYKTLEKYDESQHYFELALEKLVNYTATHDDLKALEYLAHIYQSLAHIYTINGEYQKQRFYSEKIINYYQQTKNLKQSLYALIVLTRLHISANEYKPAQQFLVKLNQHLDTSENQFRGEIFLLNSQVAQNEKRSEEAIKYIKQAIEAVDSTSENILKMEVYLYASELYLNTGYPYDSIIFLKKYQGLYEQLLQQKYSENIQIKQSEIENERISGRLLDQEIISQKKQQRINKLLNITLSIFVLFLIIGFCFTVYIFRKRKTHQHLITVIESHKQQLFLLNNIEKEDVQEASHAVDNTLSELLVIAMQDCLVVWEKYTQTNKVELAERSQIWSISIDSGRLRTRSLDKYLNLKKIPENPRWRNVVKTCHFILSECELDKKDRELLTHGLNNIMAIVKKESMQ